MSLDDRDYMRDPRPIRRASDQRRAGDPRRADEVFLPGTTHGDAPRKASGDGGFDVRGGRALLLIVIASGLLVVAVAAFVATRLLGHG